MKYSMFLFLLLFRLAMSVDFEIIIEPGVHIWEISEDWNKNPEYERIDYLNSSNNHISETAHSTCDIPVLRSTKQSKKILNTGNTYVIALIHSGAVKLYYWVGAQSSEKKRINAAHSAGFILKHKIFMEMHKVFIKKLYRKAEGAENEWFSRFFTSTKRKKISRLYRVAGSRGQFIIEVPLIYSELNGSDSFVLVSYKCRKVYLWNSCHSNKLKKNQAKVLKNHILEEGDKNSMHKTYTFYWATECDPNIKTSTYNTFRIQFLNNLKGVPKQMQFPQRSANYSDEELENKRREEVNLYTYYWNFDRVIKKRIQWKILKMNMFWQNNAYVLTDSLCGNVFVILRNNADTKSVKIALSEAEKFSINIGVVNAWKRVRILSLDENERFPTYFKIYFKNGQPLP